MHTNFDLRGRAANHLKIAENLLGREDLPSLRYACLELRMSIEALVYDMIRLYYDELSADILAKWTPKAVMTELAESVPDV
jgi:hypothetical protein